MRNILFSVLVIVALVSCNATKKTITKEPQKPVMKGPDTLVTPSGLRYVIFKHTGGSTKPKNGDKVSVHYRGKLSDGTEFDNSYNRGEPFEFQLGMGKVIQGWDEGIALLGVGDSALLIIPPALAYGNRIVRGIPANSTLYFEVELVKIKEPLFTTEYHWQNQPLHTTASGLKYYIVKEGTGIQAYSGADVKVDYTGYLSDGKVFDSSILREEPIAFKVGVGMVIRGWDEGILLMRQGAKYRFIIPANLAYGDQEAGGGLIPAGSTLTFDCELLSVK